jgi:hypothetical protein
MALGVPALGVLAAPSSAGAATTATTTDPLGPLVTYLECEINLLTIDVTQNVLGITSPVPTQPCGDI